MKKWGLEQAEPDLQTKLQGLARFVPIFTALGFEFGKRCHPGRDSSGALEFPYFSLTKAGHNFLRTAYALGWVRMFQWAEWKDTPEGRGLMESHDRIAEATPDQLEKLLTVYIRGDRFNEGLLNSAFESGHLTAIVKRAEALLDGPTADQARQ